MKQGREGNPIKETHILQLSKGGKWNLVILPSYIPVKHGKDVYPLTDPHNHIGHCSKMGRAILIWSWWNLKYTIEAMSTFWWQTLRQALVKADLLSWPPDLEVMESHILQRKKARHSSDDEHSHTPVKRRWESNLVTTLTNSSDVWVIRWKTSTNFVEVRASWW